ncbi:hypothetical protein HS1genome_2168 [Sulfodiicoccus acidiphilus]|uniref:S-layer protein n=1 Tax=Sulfodiicoccus acidiphilus TaxID=1670455 RepID=A0A348B6H7_9CREN|nr:hypothetical protein [Sulfodiicoccus acidiphilus]BBD73779.1 hypothetical protein HS1genome_2168 [Sulfodiicoccus acidiphilus]
MKLRSLMLLVPILLASLIFVPQTTAQVEHVQAFGEPVEGVIAPGETGAPVNFTLINEGPYPLLDVNVTVFNVSPFRNYNYENGSPSFYLSYWPPGREISFVVFLSVSASAKQGVYEDKLGLSYIENVTNVFFPAQQGLLVPIPVLGSVTLSLDSLWGSVNNPLVVGPGQTNVPLTVVVKNTGTVTASNVTIYFQHREYPLLLQQTNATVGYVPAGQENVGTVMASVYPNVTTGVYYVPVTVHYFQQNVTELLPVYVEGSVTLSLDSLWGSVNNPLVVGPGQTNVPLTVVVKNTGTVTASNVTIYFQHREYPLLLQQTNATVGYVPAGQENVGTVMASVYPNVTTGVYYVPVTVHYFQQNVTELLPVYVEGSVTLSLDSLWGSVNNPLVVGPGQTNVPLTVVVKNTGTVTASNVTIYFQHREYPLLLQQTNATVGYVPAGQENVGTVMASVYPNVTTGVYYVPVTVHYFQQNVTELLPVYVEGSVTLSLDSLWGSVNNPLVVGPGQTNVPLTVVVKNTGTVTASNVTIYFQHREYPLLLQQTNATVGYVPAGQENVGTVMASVYPNVTTGVYYVPVTVHYFQQNVTELLPVYVEGSVTLSLDSLWGSVNNPLVVGPGQTNVPLTVVVKNTGTVTASNVTIYFQHREYPLLLQQTNATVGYVPAGQENVGTVMASVYPNVTTGVYYVPVTVHYFQQNVTELLPVTITSPNLTAILYTVPPEVFPGFYDVPITAVVVNYGAALAENVTLSISSPFQIVSQNPVKIGALPSGGRANISFVFNIPNDTKAGIYYFNLTVSYDGGLYSQQYPLKLQPKANVIVTKVYQPVLNPGTSQVGITLTIENDGQAKAQNVRIILNPSDVIYPYVSTSNPLSALTASSAGIGDLAPGQEVNVTFVIDVASGIAPGTYTESVTAVWNQTGSFVPFAQASDFNVYVSPPLTQVLLRELSSPLVIGIIVVAVVVVVGVVLFGSNKRRK